MKRFRILILVLMAILLPIRGAVAATMLCAEGEATGTATVVAEHQHHDMTAGQEMRADRSASHQHAGGDAAGDSSSGKHPTTCQFCASGGCTASIVGTVPSLGQQSLTSSVSFPALTTRVTVFYPDGQDRPPRTI